MVDGERRASRPVPGVEMLRPNTVVTVPSGYVIDQPSVRRPMRRRLPRGSIGECNPFVRGHKPIAKGRDVDAGGAAIETGDEGDPPLVRRKTRMAEIRIGILQDGGAGRLSRFDHAHLHPFATSP